MASAPSTINIRGDESTTSSSSSMPSPEQLINGAIKAVLCVVGCGNKFEKMAAACDKQDGSEKKKLACFKAAAAMQKCIQDNAALYESVSSGDADKQQQAKSSQARPVTS